MFYSFPAILSPLETIVETEKKAKEEALAAKVAVEKKARGFVNDQKSIIELLTKEKVSILLLEVLHVFCQTAMHHCRQLSH